jgi:hypothetical protein
MSPYRAKRQHPPGSSQPSTMPVLSAASTSPSRKCSSPTILRAYRARRYRRPRISWSCGDSALVSKEGECQSNMFAGLGSRVEGLKMG